MASRVPANSYPTDYKYHTIQLIADIYKTVAKVKYKTLGTRRKVVKIQKEAFNQSSTNNEENTQIIPTTGLEVSEDKHAIFNQGISEQRNEASAKNATIIEVQATGQSLSKTEFLSLETLKELNQNSDETLPRNESCKTFVQDCFKVTSESENTLDLKYTKNVFGSTCWKYMPKSENKFIDEDEATKLDDQNNSTAMNASTTPPLQIEGTKVFADAERSLTTKNLNSSRFTHKSTIPVPSALCNHVLINPIDVPIQPYTQNRNTETALAKNNPNWRVNITTESSQVFTEPIKTVSDDAKHLEAKSIQLESSSTTTNTPNSVPPPPPPFESQVSSTKTPNINRSALPVSVFTEKKADSVFIKMPSIQIDEGDITTLRTKFPYKAGTKTSKKKESKEELTDEEKKFRHNYERLLRTFRIDSEESVNTLVRSIRTMNTTNSIEIATMNTANSIQTATMKTIMVTECYPGIAQCLPKPEGLSEIQKAGNLQTFETNSLATTFVVQLLDVAELHKKLECIQFSLDFEEASFKLERWSESFISACSTLMSSEKFMCITNVVTGLVQSIIPDEEVKIYGIDIQTLTKLATKNAEEEDTTFLQFVIEYVLNKPELATSVDFYEDFSDFSDVLKTSIAEMKAEYLEWKKSFKVYQTQVEKTELELDNTVSDSELEHIRAFATTTEEKLKFLNNCLNKAQDRFIACKEYFGLSKSETNEKEFFASVFKFVTEYRQTYKAIIAQKEKFGIENNACTTENINVTLQEHDSILNTTRNKVARNKTFRGLGSGLASRNPQRRLSMSIDIQNMVDPPETVEISNSLVQILSESNRTRRKVQDRVNKSPICEIQATQR